jgi:hypothetical protein
MELFKYDLDFGELLGDSDTQLDPVKSSVVAYDSAGVDRTKAIVKNVLYSGKIMTLVLGDGVDGEDYTIYATGVGNAQFNQIQPVRVIELRVRDTIVGNL